MKVLSQARHSGLKDSSLPKLRLRLQQQRGFDPWPRNSICYRAAKKKKKKKKKKKRKKKRKEKKRERESPCGVGEAVGPHGPCSELG